MMFSIYKNGSHTFEVRKHTVRRVEKYYIVRTKAKKSGGEYIFVMSRHGMYDTANEAQEVLDKLADDRGWHWCREVKEVKGNV